MQLKEVIEQTKLTKKAIRYYESCSLIQVMKKDNGYRDYSEENVKRLIKIKKLRHLNFSTKDIQLFFESDQDKETILTEKITEVDSKLIRHHREKELLTDLIKGTKLEEIHVSESADSKGRTYLYISNLNHYFGWMNLILFTLIFIYFLAVKPLTGMNIWVLLIFSLTSLALNVHLNYRREKLKKLDLVIHERRAWEVALQILANSLQYIASAIFISDLIYHAFTNSAHYDPFNLGASVILLCLFFGVSIAIVLLSFVNVDLELNTNNIS